MAQDEKAAISIRRSKKTIPLFALAREMGRAEADFFIEAGKAILEMVETGSDEVPSIVQVARLQREFRVSFIKEDVSKKAYASNVIQMAGAMDPGW